MKTTTSLFLLTLSALLFTACQTPENAAGKGDVAASSSPSSGMDVAFSASVSPVRGRFSFPIKDTGGQWRWQAARRNALEYKWAVSVPLKGETYEFGFSLFSHGPRAESVGTFEELLRSGQVDIWKRSADGAYHLQPSNSGITARPQGDGLLIELTEPKLLGKILAEKPATLKFRSITGPGSDHSQEVRVSYP